MNLDRRLSVTVMWLFAIFLPQKVRAATLFGGDVGLSSTTGRGIADINQRLGDSRILNLKSKHGTAPQFSISWVQISESHPLLFQSSYFMSHDVVSATGLSSSVNSRLSETGLEFALMHDLTDLSFIRNSITQFGVSPRNVDFGFGFNVGLSRLTHKLDLTSKVDMASVSYELSQFRPQIGLEILTGYQLVEMFSLNLDLKTTYRWANRTQLKVRQFVVDGSDVSSGARENGVNKLAPRYTLQNTLSVGVRYRFN